MNDLPMNEPDYGTGKKKFNVYIIGVILCVVLTLIAFWAVMPAEMPLKFSEGKTFAIIFGAAILQFLVQVICFLRLNTETDHGRTNVLSFICAIIILIAIIGGSLWIMWNLSYNMMN